MRTYQETHPWINFKLDMSKATYKLWLLLGQVQAKCEHVAGIALYPDVAQGLHTVFLAKGVFGTTSIEGNTLTEEEVRQRIEGKLKLPTSKEYLGTEIDNIVAAYNQITDRVLSEDTITIQVEDILAYNKLILTNLPIDDDVIPGEIRQHSVVVGRYRGAPAEDLEYLLSELATWLNTAFAGLENPMILAILKAIIAHVYIAWIHPFGDGNGRTARLLEFQILLAAGIPTIVAHLLSNHYNQTRNEYYRHLDQSHKREDGLFFFIEYALQGFADNLNEQLQVIEADQLRVHWINYVHDQFRNKTGDANLRRRRLLLDLFAKSPFEPTSFPEVRYISPRIAEAYAGKTDKTIQRDLNELEEMGLLIKTEEGIRARLDILSAFLPQKRQQDQDE